MNLLILIEKLIIEINKTKEIYNGYDNNLNMKQHPKLKHLNLYIKLMLILFFIFVVSAVVEIEELTGKIKISSNFVIEDLIFLTLSGIAIFNVLIKIKYMRDTHFKEHHQIKQHIDKKVFPIAFTILLIVLSSVFMAVKDKSRAFNILEFSIDKDWIHIILFNIILLLYLYTTFSIKNK